MFANAPNKKKNKKQIKNEGFFCGGVESSNSATIVMICKEYTTYVVNITASCRRVNKERGSSRALRIQSYCIPCYVGEAHLTPLTSIRPQRY